MKLKKPKGSLASKFEKEVLGENLSFGVAVKALRSRDKLSQTAFAKKFGISSQYLCDIEKGRRLVSPEQAARLFFWW